MPRDEYKELQSRIVELASKDFDYRLELEKREEK
jgi:hypothetical protein